MASLSTAQLNKGEMRRRVLADLKLLSDDSKVERSLKIQTHLKSILENESGPWGAFQPLKATEPAISWSEVSSTIEWCFPILENGRMHFKKAPAGFQKTDLGFSEPIGGREVALDEIQGFVVPGLAFDRAGYRLGRGRGYYDQTLKNYKGRTIGVCFQTAFQESVPHEAHDLRCQTIVTEDHSVVIQGVHEWN